MSDLAGRWLAAIAGVLRQPAAGLAVRAGAAVAGGAIAVAVAGWTPGSIGVLTGLATWLIAVLRRVPARRRE